MKKLCAVGSLFLAGLMAVNLAHAQIGASVSADGAAPNDNAMLDIQSPATGAGKGLLIPRITENQRTNASAALAGGLLTDAGALRGGAAQGLIVYQTDGAQGFYYNTSQTVAPAWVRIGDELDPLWAAASNSVTAAIAARLESNVWATAGSTTNYLPRTGGIMSGALNMGGFSISNIVGLDFSLNNVPVGRAANAWSSGTAVGRAANAAYSGAALGWNSDGAATGLAVGVTANGSDFGIAVGYGAKGTNHGIAVGHAANSYNHAIAIGYFANSHTEGIAIGRAANGQGLGSVALGRSANGAVGVALGYQANGGTFGAAAGYSANGYNSGAALGYLANAYANGVAIGEQSVGRAQGVAVGSTANGNNFGIAIGYHANAAEIGRIAIGQEANAAGVYSIAIGRQVTNDMGNTVRLRGDLYLDGAGSIYTNGGVCGSADWGVKAFTIDHPLDPANKILRHFCLEGPEVWNVYAGNVQLVDGQAVVQLPDYYSALNLVGSEIYGLTPVGGAFLVGVGQKVQGNHFVIVGKEDGEVSWTIKVLRNDPACLEDLKRRPVEEWK